MNNKNLEYFTPGIWYLWHKLALEAVDDESISCYIWMVRNTISTLTCRCKSDAQEYLNNNPPENYVQIVDDQQIPIGMFVWSYLFHNFVNSKLNKPIMDYNSALLLYLPPENSKSDSDSEVCTL